MTIRASDFVAQSSAIAPAIPAANLALIALSSPQRIAGQAVGARGPVVPAQLVLPASLDAPRKVVQARHATGIYEQTLLVRLTIPGMTPAGDYRSQLEVTFAIGP